MFMEEWPRLSVGVIYARNSCYRRPMGRRRQGSHRRPDCPRRQRHRPLLGRQQRRSHDHQRSQGVFALHIVPAGIFYPDKTCIVGNGVAVDPAVLLDEIASLEARGVSTERLVDQRSRPRRHALPPDHRSAGRAAARRRRRRHHRPRHRPLLRRQGRPPRHPHGRPRRPARLPRSPFLRPALQERGAHAPLRRRTAVLR